MVLGYSFSVLRPALGCPLRCAALPWAVLKAHWILFHGIHPSQQYCTLKSKNDQAIQAAEETSKPEAKWCRSTSTHSHGSLDNHPPPHYHHRPVVSGLAAAGGELWG